MQQNNLNHINKKENKNQLKELNKQIKETEKEYKKSTREQKKQNKINDKLVEKLKEQNKIVRLQKPKKNTSDSGRILLAVIRIDGNKQTTAIENKYFINSRVVKNIYKQKPKHGPYINNAEITLPLN